MPGERSEIDASESVLKTEPLAVVTSGKSSRPRQSGRTDSSRRHTGLRNVRLAELKSIRYQSCEPMIDACLVLADSPGALTELCGISTLERLLRTLVRCGIARATVLSSTPKVIAEQLARPSWPRAGMDLTLRTRANGGLRLEQIVDVWPNSAKLLLVVPADAVFDVRLL